MQVIVNRQPCLVCGKEKFIRVCSFPVHTVQRCVTCGLGRLDPMPTQEQLNEHYASRSSGNYRIDLAQFRSQSLEFVFKACTKVIPHCSGTWLDLGCFDGGLLDLAKKNGFNTYGIDLQESAITIARKNHGNNVVVATSFVDVMAKRNFCSIVSAISVIEHLINPEEIFQAANQYLEPRGYLLVQTPDISSFPSRLLGSYWPCYAAPEHTHYFSTKSIEMLARQYGFTHIIATRHWKKLSFSYLFHQLQFFGSKLYKYFGWLRHIFPVNLHFSFYAGEMIYIFRKDESIASQGKSICSH